MPTTRRDFLTTAAATLAAPAFVRALGTGEKLNVGLIGTGSRGPALLREAITLGHNAVALCDVAEFRLEACGKLVADAGQPKPDAYDDYRRLLDQKNVDAVVIATPDHHHRDQLLAAVAADKDVYVETPLSKTIEEGKEMIEAVGQTRRVVQVGNQRRSGPHWRRCRHVVQSDDFGDLVWAKVWDTRNWQDDDPTAVPDWFDDECEEQIDWPAFLGKAQKRPFNPNRYWAWRWYWDYAGGLMTGPGADLLDLVQWIGDAAAPKSVAANGGVYHFKQWETPDVVHGVWDYGKFVATFGAECVNGADGVGAAFYGTRQTLVCDARGKIKLYDTAGPITPDTELIAMWEVEDETPLHVRNWLECCKSRREPNSPVELGHGVILPAHLGNLSYRTGKKVYWDADRQEIIGG